MPGFGLALLQRPSDILDSQFGFGSASPWTKRRVKTYAKCLALFTKDLTGPRFSTGGAFLGAANPGPPWCRLGCASERWRSETSGLPAAIGRGRGGIGRRIGLKIRRPRPSGFESRRPYHFYTTLLAAFSFTGCAATGPISGPLASALGDITGFSTDIGDWQSKLGGMVD